MSRERGPKAPPLFGPERSKLRAAMRTEYEAGLTIVEVAAKFARSYGTTHKLLHEAGTAIRLRGRR